MAVAVVAVVVIVAFALPRFRDFFDSLNAKLPLATRILLAITNFVADYWWSILLGGFAGHRRRDCSST